MNRISLIKKLANALLHLDSQPILQSRSAVPQNLPQGVVPFLEEEPSIKEWLCGYMPTLKGSIAYFQSLFPFTSWLNRYDRHWLLGDVIAGMLMNSILDELNLINFAYQVLPLASSSFHKLWHMPYLHILALNMGFIRLSWGLLYTGSLERPKISSSG